LKYKVERAKDLEYGQEKKEEEPSSWKVARREKEGFKEKRERAEFRDNGQFKDREGFRV
jgi:hypothetical protein